MIVQVKSNLDAELAQLAALGPGNRYVVLEIEDRLYCVNGTGGQHVVDPSLFEYPATTHAEIVEVKRNLDWELAKMGELGHGCCYVVLGIESGEFRIHGDGGPCLYPPLLFESETQDWPREWVVEGNPWRDGAAGWRELIKPGFMERWHDGDATSHEVYQRVLKGVQLGAIAFREN